MQSVESKLHPPWQQELREALRTAADLAREGFISREAVPQWEPLLAKYSFLLPRYYANLIDRSDPACPIRRQAIPSLQELAQPPGFSPDPLHDLRFRPVSRVTHRYKNRALFHLTPNCSMYCRYCFRKTLLNEASSDFFSGDFAEALSYFETHSEIEEVIFSGGDPFLLSDATLSKVLHSLTGIRHLKRLRFHTRVPVTLPARVTTDLCRLLGSASLPVIVVTHFNHPKEITLQTGDAAQALASQGITLLNQSVLLSGVNDASQTLKALSEGLFSQGILPYYLHHPDRAQGTAHFDLSPARGLAIYKDLRSELPGYLVPRYVIDRGDTFGKCDVSE